MLKMAESTYQLWFYVDFTEQTHLSSSDYHLPATGLLCKRKVNFYFKNPNVPSGVFAEAAYTDPA